MRLGSGLALVMVTMLACNNRIAAGFMHNSRALFSFSTASTSKSKPTIAAGLRHPRPKFSGSTLTEYILKLQKEEGKFMNFRDGMFLESTATSADAESKMTDVPSLPEKFPLEGKIISNCPPRLRFAPSPTGSLHVGGARTALYNWLLAKKGQIDNPNSGAAFVLRIEDTDLERSTKESERSVLQDLEWLGLIWDEGPTDEPDCSGYGPYRQSERGNIYVQAAEKLVREGKAYRCFCTNEELEEIRSQQEAQGLPTRYDGRWRDAPEEEVNKMLQEGRPYTVRFRVPEGARVVIDDVVRGTVAWDADATVGDFIILRSNGVPVYNFCVAVDDALMAISTVVRAEEHLTNTLRQGLVLDALNAPRPRYAHCSLILGEDKQKLSKRHGATSCNQFRLDGFLPDAMINYLALLGWNDGTDNEIFPRDELIEAFELERVVKSPSVFDMGKLKWVNAQHMKMMSVVDLVGLVKEQMKLENMLKDGADVNGLPMFDLAFCTTALAKQMMETTKDAALNAKEVFRYGLSTTFDKLSDESAKKMIEQGNFYKLAMRIVEDAEAGKFPIPLEDQPMAAFQDALGADMENSPPCAFTKSYQGYMKALAKEMGIKGKSLFHPVRLALTGEMSGQDVTKQLSLLALASTDQSPIDLAKVGLVTLPQRMELLRKFCESIPEEFREPMKNENRQAKTPKINGADESITADDAPSAATSAATDLRDSYDGPPISALDIRVGRITKVWEHPEADKLYCEEIDVGENEPRQIASGLRPYMKAEDMEGRKVLVLCNLKERKLVGFSSHGMVLCASNADHTDVKFVNPPIDAKIGERVTVPDFNFEGEDGEAFAENKIGKKKVFEQLAPHLVTSKYGVPEFLGRPFMTSAGICTSPIADGTVS